MFLNPALLKARLIFPLLLLSTGMAKGQTLPRPSSRLQADVIFSPQFVKDQHQPAHFEEPTGNLAVNYKTKTVHSIGIFYQNVLKMDGAPETFAAGGAYKYSGYEVKAGILTPWLNEFYKNAGMFEDAGEDVREIELPGIEFSNRKGYAASAYMKNGHGSFGLSRHIDQKEKGEVDVSILFENNYPAGHVFVRRTAENLTIIAEAFAGQRLILPINTSALYDLPFKPLKGAAIEFNIYKEKTQATFIAGGASYAKNFRGGDFSVGAGYSSGDGLRIVAELSTEFEWNIHRHRGARRGRMKTTAAILPPVGQTP